MTTRPGIVSVDEHLVEPAAVWQERLPRRLRARGPRLERRRLGDLRFRGGSDFDYELDPPDGSGDWCDVWVFDDRAYPLKRHAASAGFSDGAMHQPITYDDIRPGCHEPAARVDDMAIDHVDVALAFPTFAGPCGQVFLGAADDLGLACVRAYNDWLIDEWCGPSDGALAPVIIVPLWDPFAAAAEVRRNRVRGCRAVAFTELPAQLGLPSLHSGEWGPFVDACDEGEVTIFMPVGASTGAQPSPDSPEPVGSTLSFNDAMASLSDWLFSGILPAHPGLRVAYTQGQIGWLPFVLERADVVWERHQGWEHAHRRVPDPPSTYWYRQGSASFSADRHGLDNIDRIGAGNITFRTDYPRAGSTWPRTLDAAEKLVVGLDDETARLVLRDNGLRLLGRV